MPQAFLQAYVAAWRAQLQQPAEAEYLVIEEINRGNCAQIFGDLFQLLDRTDSGFSEYPIKADTDMQRFLSGQFADLTSVSHIEGLEDNVLTCVRRGEELVLPNNFYIWATMNTSDQSLFPIDSAFKRRWDWKYIPINNAELNYKIDVDGAKYDWWEFLKKINEKIGSATNSEDKKLGYFFCKADQEKNISAERFVSKVVFYLWNDVFKDLDESEVFRDGESGNLTFDKFYNADGGVNTEKVKTFMENLGLKPIAETEGEENEEDDSTLSNGKKFAFNGETMAMTKIVQNVVRQYGNNHPELTSAESVKTEFKKLCGTFGTTIIKTESEYHELDDQQSQKISWKEVVLDNGIKLYVYTLWSAKNPNDNFMKFISVVRDNNLGEITSVD